MVNYGALRQGQGPLTSSTSPLWDPNYSGIRRDMGAVEMGAIQMAGMHQNPHCMGAVEMGAVHMGLHHNPQHMGAVEMGAVEFGGFYGEAEQDADAVSYIDKAKAFLGKETAGLKNQWWVLLAAMGTAYVFRDKVPLLKNPWMGDSDGHRGAAYARWAYEKSDAARAKLALQYLDGRKVLHPKRRGKVKIGKGSRAGQMAGSRLDWVRNIVSNLGKPTVAAINTAKASELKQMLQAAGISQTGLTNNKARQDALKAHYGY